MLETLKVIGLLILIVGCSVGVLAFFSCMLSSDISREEENGTVFIEPDEYREGNLYD